MTDASANDEGFLDELFDRAVEGLARAEPLDLDTLLQGREHLRQRAVDVMALARDVTPATPGRTSGTPIVPGYTLLTEIGRGGSGVVYRAHQDSLGRVVALKILAPALASSSRARQRFAVEARALARLRHPNVVTVHDVLVGEHVCAYAMDWIDGPTLGKAIERGDARLTPDFIARLFADLARALAAVHGAGLVHRDVKPGNILLRADGAPVLTDFSLVQDPSQSLHTETGQFLGTAAYAAPEQLRGDHAHVGPASDVYSLGVTLYVALTGQTPFGTTTASETLRRIEGGRATPVARANPRIGRDLATIVGKAMDPEPRHRYPDAAAFADDLERLLANQPILARPQGATVRLTRWVIRNPWLATAMAILGLGSATTSWFAIEASAQATDAQFHRGAAERRATENAELARQKGELAESEAAAKVAAERNAAAERARAEELELVIGFHRAQWDQIDLAAMGRVLGERLAAQVAAHRRDTLLESLQGVNLVDVIMDVLHEELLGIAVQTAEQAFANMPSVRARLLQDLGVTLLNLHQLERAAPPLQAALAQFTTLHGPDDLRSLRAERHVARLLHRQGRLDEAATRLRGILQRLAASPDGDQLATQVRSSLASILLECHRPEEVVALMDDALPRLRSSDAKTRRNAMPDATAVMGALSQLGRHAEAERICREVVAVADADLPADDEQRIAAHGNLGRLMSGQGRLAEAQPLLAEQVGRLRAKHGNEHAETLTAIEQYGQLLRQLGRFDEAEALLVEAVDTNRRVRGRAHPNTLFALANLGILQKSRGDHKAAEPLLREAYDGMHAIPDAPNRFGTGIELGRTLVRLERHRDAIAVFREVLAAAVRVHGENAEPVVTTRAELADALYRDAAYAEALELQRQVLAHRRAGSAAVATMVKALRGLARTHSKLRDHDAAETLLREALELTRGESDVNRETELSVVAAIGDAQFERGDFAAAARSHREALAIAHERFGPGHATTITLTNSIAQSLRRLGQFAEAERLFRGAFAALRKLHGDADRRTKNAATELAILLLEAGKASVANGATGWQASEKPLLEAHRLLVVARGNAHARTRECAKALVDLYAAWHAAEPTQDLAAKLARWTAELQAAEGTPGTGR